MRALVIGMSQNYGGTEAVIMSVIRSDASIIHHFDFLNVYDGPIACEQELLDKGCEIKSLKLQRRRGLFRYFRGLRSFFSANAGIYDALILNEQDPVNLDLIKYAKKAGIPNRIIHAHNSGYGTPPKFLARLAIWWNKQRLGRLATALIACSEEAARFNFGRYSGSAKIVFNGIDLKRFRFSEESRSVARNALGFSDSDIVFLNVGRLDPQKNQHFLLDCFADASKKGLNSSLLIVGEGILEESLKSHAMELGINDRVRFLGSSAHIEQIYCAADAFLLPSLFEGFPVSLIEAQSCGLRCYVSSAVTRKAVLGDLVWLGALDLEKWSKQLLCFDSPQRENRLNVFLMLKDTPLDSEKMAERLLQLCFQVTKGRR